MKHLNPFYSHCSGINQSFHELIECGKASLLKTPYPHGIEIHALFLLATNEQGLIEVGARFTVDVACKTILHAVRR